MGGATPTRRLALRVRVEATLGAIFAVLAIVTTLSRSWIESTTGLDPDGGSGATEWMIVAAFAVSALAAAALAGHEHRKLRAAR
jgi:hypothetical protein